MKDLFATSAGFCSNISLAEGRYSFQIVEMSLSSCSGLLSRIRPLLPIPLAVDQVCKQLTLGTILNVEDE